MTEYPIVARPPFRIDPTAGAATLAGEALGGVDEKWISDGRQIEIEVELTGDTWVADVGDEDYGLGATTALLGGLRALQNSQNGWNAVIAPGLEARNLERLSATRARITVDRFFDFDISLPEEVSLSIPAAALTSSMAIVATPSFDLLPTSASVSIGGELADGSTEIAIQAGLEPVLTVQLNSDTLVTTIGREYAADGPSKEFILGLVSEQNEPYGWNNIVQSGLRSSDIQYIDASTVHLKVPQFPSYDIAQPETIVMRIPASAMRNNVEDIRRRQVCHRRVARHRDPQVAAADRQPGLDARRVVRRDEGVGGARGVADGERDDDARGRRDAVPGLVQRLGDVRGRHRQRDDDRRRGAADRLVLAPPPPPPDYRGAPPRVRAVPRATAPRLERAAQQPAVRRDRAHRRRDDPAQAADDAELCDRGARDAPAR